MYTSVAVPTRHINLKVFSLHVDLIHEFSRQVCTLFNFNNAFSCCYSHQPRPKALFPAQPPNCTNKAPRFFATCGFTAICSCGINVNLFILRLGVSRLQPSFTNSVFVNESIEEVFKICEKAEMKICIRSRDICLKSYAMSRPVHGWKDRIHDRGRKRMHRSFYR